MYKKGDARASLFFCQSKPIAFSSCSPSPLQKLPIVVIQKFCYHGNVTSRFSLPQSDVIHSMAVMEDCVKESFNIVAF